MKLISYVSSLCLLLLFGCLTPDTQAPAPESFAVFKNLDSQVVTKAVSAEGLVYRVRYEKQDPTADAGFWREALTRKLERDGYLILKSEDRTVGGGPGGMVHAVAPLAGGDFGFIVAFTPVDNYILIAESAGTRPELERATVGIVAAIDQIKVDR